MGFRFRRSISLLPGVRLNLSNGSPSLSLGPRGASISIGSQGTFANVGLPGTGLSYRQRIGTTPRQGGCSQMHTSVEELKSQAAAINGDMDWISNIHVDTPNPAFGLTDASLLTLYLNYHQRPFSIPAPVRPAKPEPLPQPIKPELEQCGLLSMLFTSEQQRQQKYNEKLDVWQNEMLAWEHANQFAMACYEKNRGAWAEQYAIWKADKDNHAANMAADADVLKQQFMTDQAFFEQILLNDLTALAWPRETTFSFEVDLTCNVVSIDVDLPEYEDIPPEYATLNVKQDALIITQKSDKKRRLEYARHIHGCVFRIVGEIFKSLPVEKVVIAGFTQRLNAATGDIVDEYIIQCAVERKDFLSINFDKLNLVDPVSALESFQLTRIMTSTGIFKTIGAN